MSDNNELDHRVLLTTALQNIANYKDFMTNLYKQVDGAFVKAFDYSTVPRAFAIAHADLLQILGLPDPTNFPGADHFRLYFALDPEDEQSPSHIKTYLVPMVVDEFEDGSDDIPVGDVMVNGKLLTNVPFVYDFSLPCPNTCDTISVLFKVGDPK